MSRLDMHILFVTLENTLSSLEFVPACKRSRELWMISFHSKCNEELGAILEVNDTQACDSRNTTYRDEIGRRQDD